MLILEDPGGEPLDRLLGQPMELSQFLRFAVGLAAALGKRDTSLGTAQSHSSSKR
jgi:hypothetical protein